MNVCFFLRQYVKRWGCEDAIRFLKQEFHLEDIRVLKFTRIRRVAVTAMLVFAFLYYRLHRSAVMTLTLDYVVDHFG